MRQYLQVILDALAVPHIKVTFVDTVFDTNGDMSDEINKRQSDMDKKEKGWAHIGDIKWCEGCLHGRKQY